MEDGQEAVGDLEDQAAHRCTKDVARSRGAGERAVDLLHAEQDIAQLLEVGAPVGIAAGVKGLDGVVVAVPEKVVAVLALAPAAVGLMTSRRAGYGTTRSSFGAAN